ncbi:tetratricopeptide repeat-containing sensor histidine kinase [Spirosoma oryzicola]|uniref:tetratricopeptide repeat-containing sensor histidine kinase n=1 Tax=Spirosoma oryzicola TaxID=2898794 RepID=UPI001E54B35C|nr:sensor histidine kinase [Spirosoma oryzicola]UHG92798.1 sensor histidine kinase [Spirosoma oryzicola]
MILPFWWIAALLLVGVSGRFQPVKAVSESASIDSLKNQIKRQVNDKKYEQVAKSYEQLGWQYHQRYGYNKYTIDSYFNSLKYYSLADDSLGYYNEHIVIGDYYTHDYFMQPYADKYLRKAQSYFERTHNMPKVIECRLGLANIAQNKNPIPRNLITQLREAERLSVQYKQAYSQAYAQNLLANTYSRLKQPDSADYFASKSLVLSTRLKINWLIALDHFYLGLVKQFRDQSKEAIEAYQRSFKIARTENNIAMLRELSRHTADSYSRIGDYKNAYEASLKALDFEHQFYSSEQTKSIRLQELDSQIKTLAVEKQLAEQQSQHQRVLNSMLAVGLLISVLGVGALIYLRRQQKLIAHQQTVIAQQQIRQLELKSLRAMIEGQEGERSRIARDLHDGLGIQLSRIKLFVEAHQEQLPLSVKEPLNQFLDEACTETRLISNDLRPYALSTFGLIPALEDLVQKLNLVNQTKLVLEHYGEVPALDDEASVMIYRVVQELLNNALKHASAQTITVQLMASDETTLISVDDDGQGGDFENTPLKGNGIANIKSRIAYLGGQVMWQSEPGKGTSVMISLPVHRQAQPILSSA